MFVFLTSDSFHLVALCVSLQLTHSVSYSLCNFVPTPGLIDELVMRFEKPNPGQRWDNPCFVVTEEDVEGVVKHLKVRPCYYTTLLLL